MQVLGVLAQLDRYLGIIRAGDGDETLVDIDSQYLGIHDIFTGNPVDQNVFCLHRETGCRQE
ncbi:hypothetical protein D9M71_675770 [compost metagenome]